MIHISFFNTPFGELILGEYQGKLCLCDWKNRTNRDTINTRIKKHYKTDFQETETDLIKKTKIQLTEYFNKKRKNFDIPFKLIGTDFQISIWKELNKIPYGKTYSYSDLANKINKPKAVRPVASAVGANALSLIIPCHRIIGKNNTLTGYAGGLEAKKRLIKLESGKLKVES